MAQNDAEWHATASKSVAWGTAGLVRVHADAPPVIFVEVKMRSDPLAPTATQKDLRGHEMLPSPRLSSRPSRVQAAAPPVGLVEVKTSPSMLVAAQNDSDGQETSTRPVDGTLLNFHVARPPVGLVAVAIFDLSMAMQSCADGQDTLLTEAGCPKGG